MVAAAVALIGLFAAGSSAACTVSPNVVTTLGTYSPAAVNAGAVAALRSQGGLTCSSGVLTLLGGNYMRATFGSLNGLHLKQQGGTATVSYIASADPNGTYPFAQGSTIDYMQNNLLNLLGLLGSGSANLPIFVRPVPGATLAPGLYADRITIDWSWYQCPGIGLLGDCIGAVDSGAGRATVDVTLVVSPQGMILTLGNVVTWDAVNGTVNPKALPGSRMRTFISATNPDIVALDSGTVTLVVPTAGRLFVGLDGDGTASPQVVQFTEGSPPSGVSVTYNGASDMTDDVDFSADGGITWNYVPVAGDVASESAVTHVRLRPRGVMAKQSAFSVSLPYVVR